MFLDLKYLLFALPGMLIGLWAHLKLHAAYGHYSEVAARSGLTGCKAARRILDDAGLNDVPVKLVEGELTDHYDPTERMLFLCPANYHGTSLAAVGVAAHEAGHALQHQAAYALFDVRMAMVPITQFASYAWMGIIVLGFFIHLIPHPILIAVGIFSVITLFQLVTLPVEYDASSRAKEQLFRLGVVQESEREGVSKVLNAAALTYVAALASSITTLLYWISLIGDDRD